MYHSQHRPKSNRISQLFRCDFPAMRLHGGFDDGQANSDSLHRARVRFIHGTFTPAWFSHGHARCLRRFERSDYDGKGVSLSCLHVVARKLPHLLYGPVFFALLFP